MKILHVADIHINLHKKKVPYEWQYNRYSALFSKLSELEKQCDVVVIAGDIFDRAPETDEICLFLSYINSVTVPALIIPGNHEATSKGKSFLEHFTVENAITNSNVTLSTKNTRLVIKDQGFQLFPYGEMQIGNIPKYVEGDILITHIRGEVPPHITEEFDFAKISQWPLVLLGDLHFQHRYKNYNMFYSGSPVNTSFDRSNSNKYGVNLVSLELGKYSVEFIDLDLPKLIRKTVTSEKEIVQDRVHHVIYEVVGSIDTLSKITNHELLDKKIAEKPSEASVLELSNKTINEELALYLEYLKVENIEKVLELFKELEIRQ